MQSPNHRVSLAALTTAILLGKRHQGGLKIWPCAALDADWFGQIRGEVERLAQQRVPSESSRPDHPSNWVGVVGRATQHSLFNGSGDTADYHTDFDRESLNKSVVDDQLPGIERLVTCFAERVHNFRLSTLFEGAALRAHEEPIVRDNLICLRFHLPVITNDLATLVVDGERFHFEPGIIYYFNKGCVHAAENLGDTPRYHLLWDLWLDQWVFEALFAEDAAATPDPGLRRLDPRQAVRLCASVPVEVGEYVQGTATGSILRARRQKHGGRLNQMPVNFNPDIVPTDESISLSGDWHPLEHWGGETFRWVSTGCALNVLALEDGVQRVEVELEPGPGVTDRALQLGVVDADGCEVFAASIAGRQVLGLALPVHEGARNRFHILARNGGRPIDSDPRLLDFRVFRIARCE